jgi:hypothetical protein
MILCIIYRRWQGLVHRIAAGILAAVSVCSFYTSIFDFSLADFGCVSIAFVYD